MELKNAEPIDMENIMKLINQAKEFLRTNSVNQWQNGYPDQSRIEQDIQNRMGYLCLCQKKIIGYVGIDFGGEPAYDNIEGEWLSIQPYVVVHRLVLDNDVKGQGLASQVFGLVEEMSRKKNIHSFKIDTNPNNKIMNHLLKKDGFHYCGIIEFDNTRNVAYEKLI